MDELIRLFIRMALWIRRPPSRQWLIVAAIAVALSIAIVLFERFIGWPSALRLERVPLPFWRR